MSRSGARGASTPVREPIQAHPIERSRRRAATARPGLVWPPVPPPAMTTSTTTRLFALALERELDQAVEQLAVAELGSLPHSRVPARRGEPGDRVDLVDEDPIALEKEVHPRHAGAVDGAVRLERERADPPGRLGRKGGWHRESRLAIRVLRRVVVDLARVRDLAGQGGNGLVVPEHAHLDLAAGDGAFDEDLPVVARRLVERPGQGVRVADLADPDRRAEIRRLDEAGEAEGLRDPARDALGRPPPFVTGHHEVLDDGQAVGLEHRLHRRLVHPDRGGEHARADVGQVGELEDALDRAVLAVRAVEHDDDDVEVAHLGGETPRGVRPGEGPPRRAVDRGGAVGQRPLYLARAVVPRAGSVRARLAVAALSTASARSASAFLTSPAPSSEGRATRASAASARKGSPPTTQRPSRAIPIGTTVWPRASSAVMTEAADARETSCSPDRPPKTTPTRRRDMRVTGSP